MLSLRFKILAVAAILVLLSQIATVAAVLFTANRDVAARASDSLEIGATVLEQAFRSEAEQAENTVAALASDYGFKQVVATGDAQTTESALNNHARRAGADGAFLVDARQQIIAAIGDAEFLAALDDQIKSTQYGDAATHTALVSSTKAYKIVTVPVRAPLPIAWLSMGFALTDNYARNLEQLTGLNVSVLVSRNGAARVLASSLLPSGPIALNELKSTGRKYARDGSAPATLNIAGIDYLALQRPLLGDNSRDGDASGELSVLLSKSLTEAMAPYRLLRTAAIALAAIPLIAALIGAALLSRALTRPIQKLLAAAVRIQGGDYGTPVTIGSGDELSQFAVAFNSMQDEIAYREKRISYQAQHDSITGLFSRDHSLEVLNQKIAESQQGETLAVVLVCLKGLGEIAGTLGHDIADAYLKKASQQLRQAVDSKHTVARMEGDTFLLILSNTGATDARLLAEDLVTQFKAGVRLPDVNVNTNPIIGIALYPEHGNDHDQLLLRATVATDASSEVRRPVRFYRTGDEERRLLNMTLLQDLRRAVENDELQLHYQPKIAVPNETVCGVEALVRWNHPTYGWLPPAEFIPILEKAGSISLLTRWALEKAAQQNNVWQQAGIELTVAVNFSALDLLDTDLPWFVTDTLRDYSMPAEKLIIEITEEAMVRDFSNATTVLGRLRDLGIRISIDDFGTGYSSLSQLKMLPVNEMKIDRSFIAQLAEDQADTAIVGASIELAHKLGLSVVAEGVANGATLRWLQQFGADYAQGYYWAPPMPADELTDWVKQFNGGATRQTRALELA